MTAPVRGRRSRRGTGSASVADVMAGGSTRASSARAVASDGSPRALDRELPRVNVRETPVRRQGEPSEVAIHELVDAVVQALVSTQRELARYATPLGAFVLDELDVTLPVRMRLDALGQIMTSLADPGGDERPVAQLRLRVRPALGTDTPPDVTSGQGLAELGVLDAQALAKLATLRIFSVDDLLRVARNAAGRSALSTLDVGVPITPLLDRLAIAAIPSLPPSVRKALIGVKIESPADFLARESGVLAKALTRYTGRRTTARDVEAWQLAVTRFLQSAAATPAPHSLPPERAPDAP